MNQRAAQLFKTSDFKLIEEREFVELDDEFARLIFKIKEKRVDK